ncbi:uncharacterized protein An14g05940 [Aspergillus niger]|uniref:Contig An14c0180, genomic contig n=2 Tax=Aspergillus niger TaxID=5061 RepID=A2R3Y7_ASPNC|nr:uncharacterized protein An14g05940 [Aspergillus niger]CAK42155.1 unnamed protein product [Aspergillus niger]
MVECGMGVRAVVAFCDEREISRPGYNTFIIPSFLPMSLNVKIESGQNGGTFDDRYSAGDIRADCRNNVLAAGEEKLRYLQKFMQYLSQRRITFGRISLSPGSLAINEPLNPILWVMVLLIDRSVNRLGSRYSSIHFSVLDNKAGRLCCYDDIGIMRFYSWLQKCITSMEDLVYRIYIVGLVRNLHAMNVMCTLKGWALPWIRSPTLNELYAFIASQLEGRVMDTRTQLGRWLYKIALCHPSLLSFIFETVSMHLWPEVE